MDLWIIFLTGLTLGGLTCMAVQGGLLASLLTTSENEPGQSSRKQALTIISVFLIAKIIAYTILGFALGAFGSVINISGNLQTSMQLIAGLYMIAVALNLLNIHPIFRYVIFQPPTFLARLIRNKSRSKDIFAPALVGFMTILIPCGTTVAMEALAISSANPFMGASIMAAFTTGTIPLFVGLGYLTTLLGETFKSRFLKLAAAGVLYIGLSSVNGALTAFGSPITFQSLAANFPITFNSQTAPSSAVQDLPVDQNPTIIISSSGYTPNFVRVKKGQPVTLTLVGKNAYSCASAFRIPSLKIARNIQANATEVVTFTPSQIGKIPFTCSMGMYTGVIEVI